MTDAKKRRSWEGERVLMLSPTPTHPQDFGNRKRIFQICRRLQAEGAEITLAHYPAEAEWRRAIPWESEHAMARAWTQYYTIPPSRGLHAPAKGDHHAIDEWWDDSIGTFLRWLFSVQPFDSFIVNYAWLSRAFEFAPPPVVRILDTHDKKSGRRELLESHGIAREFFFTTEEQEAVALNRAHLVWAIKDEERVQFERIGRTPAIAMPHLDPLHPIPRPEPDPDGYMRVGFLAARNSINQVNISEFLKIAAPIFRRTFAPVKIVIAGSICDNLNVGDVPFVEVRGRVADVDAFYRSVDCVAIPMVFSTGLKIKTGEAISASMPIVSTAHAFEGYAPMDAMHSLADHEAVANALVDLSFAPRSRLNELAAASMRSHAATARIIGEGFARTRALVREKQQSIVVAVDSRAFVPGTIFNLVLNSLTDYLRALANVTILIVKGSAADVIRNQSAVDGFGRVAVSADLPGATESAADLARMRVRAVDVGTYLTDRGIKVLVADAMHPAFHTEAVRNTVLFARLEMIAHSEGRADIGLAGAKTRRTFVVSPYASQQAASVQAAASGSLVLAPCFNRARDLMRGFSRQSPERTVALLGSTNSRAMTLAVTLAASWGFQPLVVTGLDASPPHLDAASYAHALLAGRATEPAFAVDLSGGQLGLQLCREILERQGVPVVAVGPAGLHNSIGHTTFPFTVGTESQLFDVFRAFALEPQSVRHAVFQNTRAVLESDRGWAYMWAFCKQLFETQDAEFA